jgi:uncharacterized protein (TIGR02679 family)
VADPVADLIADERLAPLWAAVHQRLCKGNATRRSVVTVRTATLETRRSVDRLLGRVSSAGELRVRLDDLEAALGRAGTTTIGVVTAAVGPVIDRSAARAAAASQAGEAWADIQLHPTVNTPALRVWLDGIHASGRINQAGGPAAILDALDVLAVLPVEGDLVGRPVLAATVLGREHALDDDTPVGRLVTAGLAARLGTSPPTRASERAALWASAGVTLDSVSTPAVTLGLRPLPVGPLTEAAARWAGGGVPLPLPGRAVNAERWALPAGTVVSVCENPSVIEAAAAKFGSGAPPLVCVSGMPGRAVTSLLESLVANGAALRYHGDFGAGGITIANLVVARHGATPWMMSSDDHARAVDRLASLGRTPNRLRGRVPNATWDAALANAITAYAREITEEHVLDDLLDDLAATARNATSAEDALR